MSPQRTILIFGAGPGIGNHVASTFASHGFTHIILLARNEDRLQEYATSLTKAHQGVKVDTLRLDLLDLSSIASTLRKIEELAPEIEVVFFNAARIKFSGVLDVPVEEIDEDFRTTNLALYLIAQWSLPRLQTLAQNPPSSSTKPKPSLLVTSSHLPWDPAPPLLSLSITKASQRTMVHCFARAFQESGVHCALVSVEGAVAPENKKCNPAYIAERTWELFEAGTGLDVRIADEGEE